VFDFSGDVGRVWADLNGGLLSPHDSQD